MQIPNTRLAPLKGETSHRYVMLFLSGPDNKVRTDTSTPLDTDVVDEIKAAAL